MGSPPKFLMRIGVLIELVTGVGAHVTRAFRLAPLQPMGGKLSGYS